MPICKRAVALCAMPTLARMKLSRRWGTRIVRVLEETGQLAKLLALRWDRVVWGRWGCRGFA